MGAVLGDVEPAMLRHVAINWLAADARPRLIVRTDASLLWLNRGAQRLLVESASIKLIDGVVRLIGGDHDIGFHAFLKGMSHETQALAVKFDGEGSFCVFRGRTLPGIDGCCLDVRFASPRYRPSLLNFEQVFGLTTSEARTASALYGGQSASEVARDQHISIDTVRSHIRQLYSKMGVSGREQLFHQLDAFRLD